METVSCIISTMEQTLFGGVIKTDLFEKAMFKKNSSYITLYTNTYIGSILDEDHQPSFEDTDKQLYAT